MDDRIVLTRREAARRLGVCRNRTLPALIRAGLIRVVPWGKGTRIPLAEIERLAREGYEGDPTTPRAPRAARSRPGRCDPDALRSLDVSKL